MPFCMAFNWFFSIASRKNMNAQYSEAHRTSNRNGWMNESFGLIECHKEKWCASKLSCHWNALSRKRFRCFLFEFQVNVHNKRANIRKQFVKCAFNVPRNGLTSNEKLSTDYFGKVRKHQIDPITMQSNTIQDVNDSICCNTVRESANVIWQWFEVSLQCVAFVRKIVELRPRLHVFLCWFHFDSSLNSFCCCIFLFLFYLTIETKKNRIQKHNEFLAYILFIL